MAERERRVIDTFVELADTLTRGHDIGEFLHMLVERCAVALEVVTGGVMLEAPDGPLRLAASTSTQMQLLEEAEIEQGEGPCHDAYRTLQQVSAADLREEYDRWPVVAPHAVEIGLLSVHAFPLRLRDDGIGALNLYRDTPGRFSDEDVRLAQAFADVAAVGILRERKVTGAERRAQQLQGALDSRVVIEQAKGMLAERLGIRTSEAFERMRAYSRSHHEKLRDVCHRVVEEGFVPE